MTDQPELAAGGRGPGGRLGGGPAPGGRAAGGRPGRAGITVTGAGTAAVSVDQVSVALGIALVRSDAGAAFQAAAETATRVLAILADDGADSRSVRTADLTLGPLTEWRDNRDVLVGYQAGQRLIVVLSGLAGVGRLLSDVALHGGEGVRIDSLTLAASDPQAAVVKARSAAFADATARAGQLAQLAGRLLGRLEWVQERADGSYGRPASMPYRAAAAAMPMATGDVHAAVSLDVHWSFAD